MDPLSLGLLAGSAIVSGIGSAVGSSKADKARKEENKSYRNSKNFLQGEYYRDPLSSVSNRSLLKTLDQRMGDNLDAIENRAEAGGATMENRLAARQSNNEVMSNAYSNLLQGEDARRQQLNAQKLQLDMGHSQNVQNGYVADAQAWSNWGSSLGGAIMSYGMADLLSKPSTPSKGLTLDDIIKK